METDYSTARFFAIGGIGYGKGFTVDEARDNYVAIQRSNFPHIDAAELTDGNLRPVLWQAPEGVTGFFTDGGAPYWTQEGEKARQADWTTELVDNPFAPVVIVDVEAEPPTPVHRFDTTGRAERWLDHHEDQLKVARGGFHIDSPSED